jgi:hypothetical protein
MPRSCIFLAFLTAPLLLLWGCGSDNSVWVTGKLVKGGAKYDPPAGQVVYVTFVGLETKDASGKSLPGGDQYMAELDQATGTFSVPGRERRGIPPGKYRIAVTQKMTRETFDALNPQSKKGAKRVDRETDTLGDQFGLDKSPIVREVLASSNLTIDLDQPTDNPR